MSTLELLESMNSKLIPRKKWIFVVAGPIVAAILVLKYLPILLLGIFVGKLAYASKMRGGLKSMLRIIFCFILLLYLSFGLPFGDSQFWPGVLFSLPSLNEVCVFSAKVWNRLPFVATFFPHLLVSKITIQSVKEYGWVAFVGTLTYLMCRLGMTGFRTFNTHPGNKIQFVLSTTSRVFCCCMSLVFGVWLRIGKSVYSGKESPMKAISLVLVMGVIGYRCVQLAPLSPYIDIQWVLSCCSFLPFLGCLVGLLLGFPSVSKSIDLWLGRNLQENQPGFLIGKTFEGKPYRLTERNLGYHIEMVAPSGAGKTNQLKGLIADRIRKGHGLIFLDYKAEFEMISWVFRAAKSVNRENEVRLLSLSDRELSVPYNPIKDGDATDIQSALMNSMTWSEQYYRAIASTTLMTVIKPLCIFRDHTKEYFHIGHIYELLDQPGLLRAFADRLRALNLENTGNIIERLEVLASRLDKPAEREKITGLMANLDQLLSSSAGELISQDVTHGSYGILEAVLEGRITVMLMNSLKLKESARVVGKTIIQDLIRYVGTHYANIEQRKVRPITVIIDEFASCAIPEFIEFMDRARGAGIGIVIAHQARADLREVSPEFQSRIETNSNTTIVSGVKDPVDAEYYAGMLGTRTVVKKTSQKKEGILGEESTGMKSTREAEEFILHPNKLKSLNQGEVFAISRTTDPNWGLVKVLKAPEFEDFQVSNSDLIQHFKNVRQSYLNEKRVNYLDLKKLDLQPASGLTEATSQDTSVSVAEAWN